MHTSDVLKYGHSFIERCLPGFNEDNVDIPGACGVWSVREIIAHLASFEHVLSEIIQSILDENSPTPLLMQMGASPLQFNDDQVAARKGQTWTETWTDYETAYQKNLALFDQIPAEKHRQSGLLAWYGAEYDLEDFIVYTFYGHKREHGAQINAFRDILNQQ